MSFWEDNPWDEDYNEFYPEVEDNLNGKYFGFEGKFDYSTVENSEYFDDILDSSDFDSLDEYYQYILDHDGDMPF